VIPETWGINPISYARRRPTGTSIASDGRFRHGQIVPS
jgi:hypothetical protein